jgi:hypothetical protein
MSRRRAAVLSAFFLACASCADPDAGGDAGWTLGTRDTGGDVEPDAGPGSNPDARDDATPSPACVIEGASFTKVYDEGSRPIDVSFAGSEEPGARLGPFFEPPEVFEGEARFTPSGLEFFAGDEGLDAYVNNGPFFIESGGSLELAFTPTTSPGSGLSGRLGVSVVGVADVGTGSSTVLRGGEWAVDFEWGAGAGMVTSQFARGEAFAESPAFPYEPDGSELTLRIVNDGASVDVALSRGDEVLAALSSEREFTPIQGFFLRAFSEVRAPMPTPILRLRAVSSDDMLLFFPSMWSLDAPALSRGGVAYARDPNYRVAWFVGSGPPVPTRVTGDPAGELALLPYYLGPDGLAPLRYYLIEDVEPDGSILRSTVYSPWPRERVIEGLTEGAPTPFGVNVAAEGVAFDLVDGAYVPAFPPEVCPAR